jgi:hypothetical protein
MGAIFNRVTDFRFQRTNGSVFLSFRPRFLLKVKSPCDARKSTQKPQGKASIRLSGGYKHPAPRNAAPRPAARYRRDDAVYLEWRKIVVKHRVTGVQSSRCAARRSDVCAWLASYSHVQRSRFQPIRRLGWLRFIASPSDSRSSFDATHTAALKVS